MFENDTKYACLLQRGDTPLHIAIRFRDKKVSELLLRNPKDGRLLYKPNRDGDTPYNIDCNHQKGILTQIFGASKLNIFVWILCGMIDRGKWLWLWGESVDCKKRWDVYICLPMWSIYILFLRLFYRKVSEQIFWKVIFHVISIEWLATAYIIYLGQLWVIAVSNLPYFLELKTSQSYAWKLWARTNHNLHTVRKSGENTIRFSFLY